MKSIWNAVHATFRKSGLSAPAADHATNLALASAISTSFAPTPRRQLSHGALRCEASRLSQALDANRLPAHDVIWRQVSTHVRPLHGKTLDDSDIDTWIEAFQESGKNRKSLGAFATPTSFAAALAELGLRPFTKQRSRSLRIVDPACGPGSLLLAAKRYLIKEKGISAPDATRTLFGVEIDPAARELCILILWLADRGTGPSLEQIAQQIILANGLADDWWKSLAPFDAVIMNPPWESLRHTVSCPTTASDRRATIDRLKRPVLGRDGLPALFSLQGSGDANLYKAFLELAPHLIHSKGRVSALIPAAFGSDKGMAPLRSHYIKNLAIEQWTTFENKEKIFDIDSRYKFGVIVARRSTAHWRTLKTLAFQTSVKNLVCPHIILNRNDLTLLGGEDLMLPEVTDVCDIAILRQMMREGTPLFHANELGRIHYKREVDLTMGRKARAFIHITESERYGASRDARWRDANGATLTPVLEGRMVSAYDCFQKSFVHGEGRKAKWRTNGDNPIAACRPQYVAPEQEQRPNRIALCDVTSATNSRTVLAARVPEGWLCGNSAPVLNFETETASFAALAILNSMIFDWQARRIIGGLHVNKFYLARFVWPKLSPGVIDALADAARAIAASAPRGCAPSFSPPEIAPRKTKEASVAIERAIATEYGLDKKMLSRIYSQDAKDRRGLWRYFKSNPQAASIAEAAMGI